MTGNAGRRSRAGEGGRPRFFRHIILKSHLNWPKYTNKKRKGRPPHVYFFQMLKKTWAKKQ